MPKRLAIVVGLIAILVAGGLGYMLWQNANQQRANEQRLAELQRQVNAAAHGQPAPASQPGEPSPVPSVLAGTTTQNLSSLQQQRDRRAVMEEGWALINERKPKAAAQAVAIFREGIEKVDSHNAQFYNGLGRALLIAGQPREAITAWQQGLTLDPKISDMHSGIGWAYWALQDGYHAKAAWEQALDLNPKSIDALSSMAWIYLALGDTEKSKAGFQVLFLSDHQNKSWIYGLQMAQAKNTDPAQISKFFPLPDLAAFKAPPATAAATRPSTEP